MRAAILTSRRHLSRGLETHGVEAVVISPRCWVGAIRPSG